MLRRGSQVYKVLRTLHGASYFFDASWRKLGGCKLKILLINIPTYLQNVSGKRKPDTFPLGLLYIARALMENGHEVSFFDILAEDISPKDVVTRLNEYKKNNYDLVGFSAMSVQYIYAKWLSKQIKNIFGNIPIIVGGAAAIHSGKVLLENTDVDIVVTGEGEKTIIDLVEKSNYSLINGIGYRNNGNILFTPPADLISDLDTISFPALELLNMDIYQKSTVYKHQFSNGESVLLKPFNICSGRGCPFNCNFCSRCFPGVRLRSISNIHDELIYWRKKFDFNYVVFTDELPLINKQRILKLSEAMSELGLYWCSSARIDVLDNDSLRILKESGCISLSIGVETGSQKLLDSMNKKTMVSKTKEILKEMYNLDIIPSCQLIFGYPGEDEQTIEETYQLFSDIPLTNAGFYILTPLPGSKVYNNALESGIIADEDEYLSSLETGTKDLHINFTKWSDDKFMENMDLLTKTINFNGLKVKYGLEFLLREVGEERLIREIGECNTRKIIGVITTDKKDRNCNSKLFWRIKNFLKSNKH